MRFSLTDAHGFSAAIAIIVSVVVLSVAAWAYKPLKNAMVLVPYRVKHDYQVHRLLTAGWVHGDISHLLFNMLALYLFAGQVEADLGPVRFLVLYVVAVVVAFIPTTLRFMNKPQYASLGASGAVAAVMFSAIALHPTTKIALLFLPIPVPGWIFAIVYLAYSMYQSRRGADHVNHDAHFFGAAVGAGLTYLFEPARVEHALRAAFS